MAKTILAPLPASPAAPVAPTGKAVALSTYATMQAQAAQAQNIPVIQTGKETAMAAAGSFGNKQLAFFTLIIPSGAQVPVQIAGDYVFISTVSGIAVPSLVSPLTVKPDIGPAIPITSGNIEITWPTPFNFLQLSNPAANGQITVALYAGFGRYKDGTLVSSVASPVFNTNAIVTLPNPAVGAYAANKFVGPGPFSFANVIRSGGTAAIITKARLFKSSLTIANANFRLLLFAANLAPYVDDADWLLSYGDAKDLLGIIDFPSFVAGAGASDGAVCVLDGLSVPVYYNTIVSPLLLYGELVALGAYVPTNAETFRIDLSGTQS